MTNLMRNVIAATLLLAVFFYVDVTAGEHEHGVQHHEDEHHTASRQHWLSEQGLYTVSYTSSVQPIEINRMHEWVLHIETEAGDVVENAAISIEGGMPAHNHGMPTSPRVTEYLGNGDYRVQGLRFHMKGEWQIIVTIEDGDRQDRAVFAIVL